MKKINTILAALGALLMLSVTSANSVELRAGVTANTMAAYANAKETIKGTASDTQGTGRTTNEEAILATSFASVFAEISSDGLMGLGFGVSYAPEIVDLNSESRNIQQAVSGEGDTGEQVIDGKVNDFLSLYLTLPVGDSGAYVKAGYIQAKLVTEEQLATGSKYEDIDLTGTQVGGGYEGSLGDMVFWRAEGSYQMWEDISASGSEADNGTTDTSKNKIEAELGSVTGSFSIGMKF